MNHEDFLAVYTTLGDLGLDSQINCYHYNKTISMILNEWKKYLDVDNLELLKIQGSVMQKPIPSDVSNDPAKNHVE